MVMMKVLYKKIGLFTSLCYCFGILVIAYLLISIPQDLKNLSLGLPINILNQVDPIFNKLNVSITVVLGLGITSLVLLLFNDKSHSANHQYFVAEKIKETKIANNEQIEEQGEDGLILQKTDKILAENKELKIVSNNILSAVCKEFEACQGAIYKTVIEENKRSIELISSFAYPISDSSKIVFEFGEGLVGQAAKEGRMLNIESVPDGYIKILSGLGSSSPTNLIIIPFLHEGEVKGVVEIASFKKFTKKEEETLNNIFSKLAIKYLPASEGVPSKKKTSTV